jgi:formylglycine-generating enzyme required for sulfatase activity
MYGVAWQWTRSPAAAYPGWRARDDALAAYESPFSTREVVARGGSCITPNGHVRPSYRRFLPTDARWQFTGIRLAKDRVE